MGLPFQRIIRDLKAIVFYPIWLLQQKAAPDNHLYKINRLRKIGKQFNCRTVIETGTFYGQTVNALYSYFDKIMSVEVYNPLYQYNNQQFKKHGNVQLFLGTSSQHLPEMIKQANGRILYWLDGHYSGQGTGQGQTKCPINEELSLIKAAKRSGDCIIIDDRRAFGIDKDYPTIDEVKTLLLAINPSYNITFDLDCIMALPSATNSKV